LLTGPFLALNVGPGTHTLLIRHEDDYWPDNHGSRQTDVYFSQTRIPEPPTIVMLLFGLGAAALIAVRSRK
jgi:hypothetical protein